jgi:sulfur-carrier protein
MATVTIQYWAAAREAAGVELESVDAGTLAEALDVVVARRGDDGRLRRVLPGQRRDHQPHRGVRRDPA